MIVIDGSRGEGGGQVLRTALSLSLTTGKPFRIHRIRAGRSKPGLLRQHLTAVEAAAMISGAMVRGATLGSCELVFEPGTVRPGEYQFQTGGAGSTTLVLQTILPALASSNGPSALVLEGGTHNPMAPSFEFLDRAFLPVMKRMGPTVKLKLDRHGFYPAGGGKIRATINPVSPWKRVDLIERGVMIGCRARAVVSNLPGHIAERELKVLKRKGPVEWDQLEQEEVSSHGPGNVIIVVMEFAHATDVVTGFGAHGVRAETVAEQTAKEARDYLDAHVPVGRHLADQLLLPVALAGGGLFRTLSLSSHAITNIEIIRAFLDVVFNVRQMTDAAWDVAVERS